LSGDEQCELERLRREIAELRMDRQQLKRATAELSPLARMFDLLGVPRLRYFTWRVRSQAAPGP